MIAALRDAFEQLLVTYRSGSDLVLLLDYDGTLVEIVDHPQLAILPSETRTVIEALVGLPRIHLGVLSGRHLADLRSILGIPGIYLAGTSGIEVDFAGIQVRHPSAGRIIPDLNRLGHVLTVVLADFSGAWLERKPVGFTVHFRGVATDRAGILRDRVVRSAAPFANRLCVLESALALEVTPVLGWDKGTAVRMIVDSLGVAGALVFYAGDSPNDVDAIAAVIGMAGVAIGVGPEAPPAAQIRIQSPRDLVEFLAELAAELQMSRQAPSSAVVRAS